VLQTLKFMHLMEGKEHYYITNTRRHEITKP
jgi:hypothetical protein